jgi:hypothetical protein
MRAAGLKTIRKLETIWQSLLLLPHHLRRLPYQPARSVGGGFIQRASFEKTPPMTRTCTACHGSRVGNEYLGKNEDIPGDVHFRQGRMNCVACQWPLATKPATRSTKLSVIT